MNNEGKDPALPVENRNHHKRQKSLLIGCGGGFLMECGEPYSPVSDWIKIAQTADGTSVPYTIHPAAWACRCCRPIPGRPL